MLAFCHCLDSSSIASLERFTCLLSLLQGGGIYVYYGGVANLDGCYVYENQAGAFLELSSSAPLERYTLALPDRVVAFTSTLEAKRC